MSASSRPPAACSTSSPAARAGRRPGCRHSASNGCIDSRTSRAGCSFVICAPTRTHSMCCSPRAREPALGPACRMHRLLRPLVLLLMTLSASAAVAEDSPPSTTAPACEARIGVPPSRLAALARGFNLPGWLEGGTPRRPDTGVLAGLRARGFSHIRLPVGAERLMEEFSLRTDVARQLAELDLAVDTLNR